MRKGVDYIGVGASFIIYDASGRVLLQKRSKHTRDEQGSWDIGGGSVEFGETLEETVRREVEEELAVAPDSISFLTMYDAHRTLGDGTPTHWISVIFAVTLDAQKVSIGEPDKIDEIGWFHKAELPSPLHSQFWKSYQPALDAGLVK